MVLNAQVVPRSKIDTRFRGCPGMRQDPTLQVSPATAQKIVDCVVAGRTVATVSNIHGGDIAAIYKIEFEGPEPSLVLKVYPDLLHWKMRKEVTVSTLIRDRLSASPLRAFCLPTTRKSCSVSTSS